MARFNLQTVAVSPPTPAPGFASIYFKTDNVLYIKDSSGVETPIGTASGITSLTGDVSATGPGAATATVNFVGGKSAADIAQSVTDTQNATSANTFNEIVRRDASGFIFVTQINGIIPEAHGSRHTPLGADPIPTAAPSANLSATTTNAVGVADFLSRSDHSHAISTGTPSTQNADQSNSTGTSSNLARADHIHNIPTAIVVDIGSANAQGSAGTFAKSDHVHKGVRSVKANSGTARFGDLSLKNGVGATVTDDGFGNFTIDVTGGSNELTPSYPGSGLTIDYTAGKAIFNGVETFIAAGSVVVGSVITNGYVYVDIDAVVKSAATLPPNTIPIAIFNSSLSAVTFLEDARVFMSQSLVWGLVGDIQPETTTSAASAGTSEKYARADHVHAISSAAAITQTPDQANAAGASASFSKADHVHNIPTDVATGLDANSANTQGVATKFARADHTHAISTGTPSTQTPDQANAPGTSPNLVRADHVHDIPTATAVGLDSTSTNTQGSNATFARSNHTHAIASGVPSTQTPNQSNNAGTSPNFAKADHIHNIPTAAPTTNLDSTTSNADGAAATFSKSDHSHAITTAAPVTQIADQSNNAGTAAGLAKADHVHNIPSGVPVQVGTSNFQGAATTFSLSDHVHAVTFGVIGGLIMSTYVLGTNAIITAADSIVSAFGKLQAQINAIVASAITSLTGDVTGTGPGATATTIAVGAVTDTKASLAVKPAVTVVATTNQALTGTPTIDGQATAAGSLILLTAQTTGSENGPWVAAAGAWSRPTWYPNGGTTQAFQFITTFVRLGTTYGGSVWRQTAAAPITIGTTSTTWVVTPTSGNYKSAFSLGPASGSADVQLNFANAFVGTLAWNPTASYQIKLPPTQGAAGTFPSNDGAGNLTWTNPVVNIDGGAPDSNYTPSQLINGGTP